MMGRHYRNVTYSLSHDLSRENVNLDGVIYDNVITNVFYNDCFQLSVRPKKRTSLKFVTVNGNQIKF